MKKLKIVPLILDLVLLSIMLTSFVGTGMAVSTVSVDEFEGVEWVLAHTRTDDSRAAKAVNAFVEALKEATDGKINITVYGNSALGDYTTVHERVSLGDVTMQMGDFSKALDSSLQLCTIPYIITDWEEFDKYYHVGSDDAIIAQFSAERVALQGITLVSCYPQYFGSIGTASPIENWDKPSAPKGLKLRIPTERVFELMAHTFGFQGTSMPASEAYTAIQTNVVDGILGGGTEYYYRQLGDLVKYLLPIQTIPVTYWLYVNTKALESIPAEYRELFYEMAEEYLYQPGLRDAKAEHLMYEHIFAEEKGATVYEVSDELLAEYTELYRQECWPALATEEYLANAGLEIFHEFMDLYGIKY